MWPLFLLPFVMYFFMIRPQTKRNKEQETFNNSIEKGQLIVTNGGVIGRVNKIDGNRVTIETADKTYIQVLRSSFNKELSEAIRRSEN